MKLTRCFMTTLKKLEVKNCISRVTSADNNGNNNNDVGIKSADGMRHAKICMEEKMEAFKTALTAAILDKLNGGPGGCGMTILSIMNMMPSPMVNEGRPPGWMRRRRGKGKMCKNKKDKQDREPKMDDDDEDGEEEDLEFMKWYESEFGEIDSIDDLAELLGRK